jgi:regulator of protease activity HflC (stomatin/prohibitin superfamily)
MIAQKRGRNVAIAGLVLQVAFTAVMLAIWLLTGSRAAMATIWLLTGGVALWLVVVLLFYTRQLQRQEAIELEEIATDSSIFQGDDRAQTQPMAARAAFIERWVIPIFTLLWAGWHGCMAVVIWRVIGAESPPELTYTSQGTLFAILIGFLAFLFSRYSTGMGTRSEWRPLRATGGYMLGCALMVGGAFAALLGAWQGYGELDYWVAMVVAILMMVLAVELVINFVLDMFRPRLPGQEARLAFDSRLLNLLAEPDRVGHSLADAVNYQFGFEVSRTWFYRLLVKSFVPLVLLGLAVLVAISSIVIVNEGQQHIISRFGRPDPDRSLTEPGLYFKLPWPVETDRAFDTGRLYEFQLGAGDDQDAEVITVGAFKGRELALWTEEHGTHEEQDFLLAVPPESREDIDTEDAADVSIIKLVASVQYRIKDAYKFGYTYTDAAGMLESLASREMVRYCSSATLDTPIPGEAEDRPEALMTYGRGPAARRLKVLIEQAIKDMDLGVEIVSVSFLTVHPPAEAAKSFEKVIEARLRQHQQRYQAQAQAVKTLSGVAGDPPSALRLALAISNHEKFTSLPSPVDKPKQFASAIEERIGLARTHAAELRQEIQQDISRGKVSRPSAKSGDSLQTVLDDYQAYIDRLERLKSEKDAARAAQTLRSFSVEAGSVAEERLTRLKTGSASVMIAKAFAERWRRELTERGKAESFARETMLYDAGPQIYMLDRWLDTWDYTLKGRHKYVIGLDPNRVEHWLKWEKQRGVMPGVFSGNDSNQ